MSFVGLQFDVGIDGLQFFPRGGEFGTTHIARVMQDLALEITEIDHVKVHQAQASDSGGGQIEA